MHCYIQCTPDHSCRDKQHGIWASLFLLLVLLFWGFFCTTDPEHHLSKPPVRGKRDVEANAISPISLLLRTSLKVFHPRVGDSELLHTCMQPDSTQGMREHQCNHYECRLASFFVSAASVLPTDLLGLEGSLLKRECKTR
jgi:hypothetical protein